jgi:HEAT repeat protein
MLRRALSWMALSFAFLAGAGPTAEADADLTEAEKVLREAKVGTDGPALLAFFRKRTLPPADRARLAGLVRRLGDDNFAAREKASRELLAVGRPALPLLRRVENDTDPEVASRARDLILKIEQGSDLALLTAAARVVAARKPKGAVPVLLAYLPLAEDEAVQEAVREALAAVGLRGGKPDPALAAALTAKEPVARGAAAFVLARLPGQRSAVRRLLADADAGVRFRATEALFRAGDKEAVPALIALLASGPESVAWQAEGLLSLLVGDKDLPAALDVQSADGRRACARAWTAWWKANQGKTDLARLPRDNPLHGLTLASVTSGGGKDGGGRIWVFGKDGRVRWEINTGLGGTAGVHLLPNGHVLVAEYQARRVTERTREGKVVWEKRLTTSAVSCQRLANGNTFIATLTDLLEVTRTGQVVYTHRRPASIYCAVKLRNNHLLFIQSNGQLVEMDTGGKEVRNLSVGGTGGWGGVEPLANGHFLVAQYTGNRVVEIDGTGKIVWQCQVRTPALATRLRNGNTLVCSSDGNFLAEIDPKGKEVWKQTVQGRPFCVRRY